jgi:hypothetical protein
MHILVVTNETAVGHTLYDAVVAAALPNRADVTVVAPALNSRLRHWCSDEDAARLAATERLHGCLRDLRAAGVPAIGNVGDADPMRAIEDELAVRPAERLIIATHPEHRSNWLEQRLVERARAAFAVPIVHVVVDLEQRVEHLAAAA